MNILSDEELENVNGGFGADAGESADEIARQIIEIGHQIQNNQPTAAQEFKLQQLKVSFEASMSKAMLTNKLMATRNIAEAQQILSKYHI